MDERRGSAHTAETSAEVGELCVIDAGFDQRRGSGGAATPVDRHPHDTRGASARADSRGRACGLKGSHPGSDILAGVSR